MLKEFKNIYIAYFVLIIKMISRTIGANIIGLKQENGTYLFIPSGNIKLKKEDKLFVLGTVLQVNKLKELLETGLYFNEK